MNRVGIVVHAQSVMTVDGSSRDSAIGGTLGWCSLLGTAKAAREIPPSA